MNNCVNVQGGGAQNKAAFGIFFPPLLEQGGHVRCLPLLDCMTGPRAVVFLLSPNAHNLQLLSRNNITLLSNTSTSTRYSFLFLLCSHHDTHT
jgi:hypothetical protein